MMTKISSVVRASVFGAATVFMVGAASAATVTPDLLLGSANLGNSGESGELAEMCVQVGMSGPSCNLVQDDKDNSVTAVYDSIAQAWVIDLVSATPGYFLLKFGVGGTGDDMAKGKPVTLDSHYFFQNIAELTKLVFTNAQVNNLAGDGPTIERISHFTTYVGPAAVPLPAAGWMLLAGLGGLAAMRKRKQA